MKQFLSNLIPILPGLTILYLIKLTIFGQPTNIWEILVYLSAIAAFFAFPSWRKLSQKEWFFLLLVSLITLISLITSNDKVAALGILKGWIIPALLVAWMLKKKFDIRHSTFDIPIMLRAMVLQGLIVALFAIGQHIQLINTWWKNHHFDTIQYLTTGRSTSLFNSPDSAAMIMAIALIISWSLFRLSSLRTQGSINHLEQNRRMDSRVRGNDTMSKYGDFLIMTILAGGVISTLSRGAIIAVVISLITFELWISRKRILGGILVVITLLLFNPIILTFIAQRNPDNMDVRVHIWRTSWQLIKNHPLFGIGLTNFQNVFQQFTLHQINFDEFITPLAVHPHNIFLYTWLLLGLWGLVGLVLLIGYSIYRAVNFGGLYAILGASLLVEIIIHGMVDNTLWKNDLIIWFTVAIVLALLPSRQKPSQS